MPATITTAIDPLPFPDYAMALPTPPFSPASASVFHHTAKTLDALVVHYQRERMWVKHTQDVIALARRHHLHGSPLNSAHKPDTGSHVPLWQRRKSRHSLRLSNLPQAKLSAHLLAHNACGPRVLDSFAALLDARIESCKRIELLLTQSTQRRRHSRRR